MPQLGSGGGLTRVDQKLGAQLAEDAQRLADMAERFPHVRAVMRTWSEHGYAENVIPEPGAGGTPEGSPIPRGALEGNPAEGWYRKLGHHLRTIHEATRALGALVAMASDDQVRDLFSGLGAPECVSCRRGREGHSNEHPQGVPIVRVALVAKKRIGVDAEGAPIDVPLCRWCYDFHREWGVLPHPHLVEMRVRDHKNVTLKRIREWHPELASAVELRERRAG